MDVDRRRVLAFRLAAQDLAEPARDERRVLQVWALQWTAIGVAGLVVADGRPFALWRGRKRGRRLVVGVEAFGAVPVDGVREQAERLAPHRGCTSATVEVGVP